MPKLTLRLILPLLQTIVAAVLLRAGDQRAPAYVPTPRLVCWGLNAPALLIRALAGWGPLSQWLPRSVRGLDSSELLFLVGVVVVWYTVGSALDRRRVAAAVPSGALPWTLYSFLFASGVFLFVLGLDAWRNPRYNNPDYPVFAALVLLWSATLLFISSRIFVRLLRKALR